MLLCYYAVNDLTVICMAFLSWQWWRTERTINEYWTELPVHVQVREVAAQLSQPLTSGQRSPSPKATRVSSSSFTLPQRGKAEAEGGGVSGKTDHGQKTLSWMSTSNWAFVILNSSSLRVLHCFIAFLQVSTSCMLYFRKLFYSRRPNRLRCIKAFWSKGGAD